MTTVAETWIEQHIGSEAVIRPEFRSNLASDLHAQWRERTTVAVRSASPPPQHRWRVAVWFAAAAAVLVGLVLVLDRPASDSPPVDSAPTTSSTSEASTTSTSTTRPEPSGEADLFVPLTGGQNLEPTLIATVPTGGGPGQLSGLNGEFPPLVVALPTSLLVLDEVPFSGLTGRALSFSRTGQWDRDLTVDGIAGYTPLWAAAAPNGLLFVATGGATEVTVTAHRLVDNTYVVVDSATLADLSEGPLHLTNYGVSVGDRRVMTIATGLASPPPSASATISAPDQGVVVADLTRDDTGAGWSVEMQIPPATPPEEIDFSVGVHSDGVWYSASVTSDPTQDNRFIAVIDSEQANWFRLGRWTLSATDTDQLAFAAASADGLELAVVGPPPPDLSADLLAAWPAPPAPGGDLSDTPMMLPSVPMPDGATRTEWAAESPAFNNGYYNQHWIDSESGALLSIQTGVLKGIPYEGEYVSVAPWDRAFFAVMSTGYENLVVVDPSGVVSLRTNGLDRATLMDIARSLQPRGTDAGWDSDGLPDALIAVQEIWSNDLAARTVRWANAELSVSIGGTTALTDPSHSGSAARVTEVNGAPAILYDNGNWSAVSWPPSPGVTVVFAMYGTTAEVEAAARSITVVDAATWEAASTENTGLDDGCQSFFFC